MFIVLRHPDGKNYKLPANQVVVYADDGQPAALAYEHGELIIHTNAADSDFASTCGQLRVTREEPPKEASGA